MSFQMIRPELPHKKEPDQTDWQNPGLFFDKGFQEWKIDSGKRGEDIGKHIRAICEISVSDIYKAAYKRWLSETTDKESFAHWFGKLDGTRLFIGLGMDHVLEAQVCRHPIYGMPYIPGSALKGLARAKAEKYIQQKQYGITKDVVEILFGTSTDDPKADAGYLIFHDAWWIPKGEEGGSEDKPYVPEIVTVHAVEYYKNQGKGAPPHPDMESPNPNQQLAVQGSFYFVIEGVPQWAKLGRKFLTLALEADGIGGKVAAGYGYFEEEAKQKKKREAREKAELDKIAAEEAKKEAWLEDEKEAWDIWHEIKRFNSLPEAERFVCELNEAVEDYLANRVLKGRKDAVSQRINRVIKSKGWSKSEKKMGLQVVSCACSHALNAKEGKKKLKKAKEWLEAENGE
ncbi:MAG: type III-B CRISPR module RAMP protein Cmr6 [Candidatus Electrothrix sp. AX5]|nr:type III-B CRISPR module RAMP protein Cmr6 [Candidatus Electrothrix sp. AX5]